MVHPTKPDLVTTSLTDLKYMTISIFSISVLSLLLSSFGASFWFISVSSSSTDLVTMGGVGRSSPKRAEKSQPSDSVSESHLDF